MRGRRGGGGRGGGGGGGEPSWSKTENRDETASLELLRLLFFVWDPKIPYTTTMNESI